MIDLRVKKLSDNAKLPVVKEENAGIDLTATSITINEKYIEYGTDLAIQIPSGYVGLLFPRSSVSKYDLTLANSVGVIDSGYRGEIKARFRVTNTENPTIYKIGERCCQLIIMEYPKVDIVEVDELSETSRGKCGFGSTGR